MSVLDNLNLVSGVPNKALDIGMIGPRGVGKTSLLAAMYHELTTTLAGSELQLTTDDPTGLTTRYLQAGLIDLQRISRGLAEPGPGIRPTYESRTLQFKLQDARSLSNGAAKHFARLRWTDYPGEWLFPSLDSTETTGNVGELEQRLAGSRALLIALDAPALMWRGGQLNDEINAPLNTREVVINKWLAGAGPKVPKTLVIFAPIKCERWVKSAEGRHALERATWEANRTLIEDLRSQQQAPQVLYMPVQTVGSLEFERFRSAPGAGTRGGSATLAQTAQAVYKGVPRGQFEPRWVSNPLKAVLIDAAEHVSSNEGILDWLIGRNTKVKWQQQRWLDEGFDDSVVEWS